MKILTYLKHIYTGKGVAAKHIMLFAYAGILVLCINNILSVLSGYLFFTPVIHVQISKAVQALTFLLTVFILVKFSGYEYKFSHDIFDKGFIELPEFDIKSYQVFGKMIPLFLLWNFYFLFALVVCMSVVAKFNTDFYEFIPIFVLILIFPFVNIIYALYSRDFCFGKIFLNPLLIVDVLNKTFKDMFLFFIRFTIFCISLGFILYLFLIRFNPKDAMLLFMLCVAGYVIYILKLLFVAGMAEITIKNYK